MANTMQEKFATIIQRQLENLFSVIELEENGCGIQIDSVHYNFKTKKKFPKMPAKNGIPYETFSAFRAQEPRLKIIGNFLAGLLTCCDFYANDRKVAVDGFRLKNLSYWARFPSETLFDNMGDLSSACNCDCKLCFLKGSAVDFPKKSLLSTSEARVRIKYYDPEKNLGLPTGNTQPGEPFLNPNAIEILKMVRDAQPNATIGITTNGELLDEKLIKSLAQLKPLTLVISVNSADPCTRREIMNSKRAETMLNAIPLLKEYGIQFSGSILAPADLPLADLENTARFLDKHKAIIIRIPLPGFTRFHKWERRFDTEERWNGIVEMADRLREEIETPFLICPSFYWNKNILAYVDGVFVNSPAWYAGIKFGDRIVEIDGKKVTSKFDAQQLLCQPKQRQKRKIIFKRGHDLINVELEENSSSQKNTYPFKPEGYPSGSGYMGLQYGIHFIDGLNLDDVIDVFKTIKKYPDAKKVLMMTTELVKDLFIQSIAMLEQSGMIDTGTIEMKVTIPSHRFWGGNILVGDLLTVKDYIDHITFIKKQGYVPDLVIIPQSFTGTWGFDLCGQSRLDIERKTGCSVVFAKNRRIMI